nr:MAG TPA: hydrogenase/urease nickel incorporation protein [Caudoviricetes sp.]
MAKCIEWKELENTITIAANRKEIDCETWARAIYLLHDVQKGCSFCKNFDWGEASATRTKGCSHIVTSDQSYHFPIEEQFNYCPVCGRLNPRKLQGEEK